MAKSVSLVVATLMLSLLPIGRSIVNTAAEDAASPVPVEPPQAALPESWGEVQGQTAHVNGIDIYYEVYGEGEPLLLLHGAFGNGTYFANQIPSLAMLNQVIVVDSRGHGRSTFDDQPISYMLMASDVLGLMDELGIAKASVVGWSDGGIIALDIAINHPERLNRVVAYGANFDRSGIRPDAETNPVFGAYIGQAALDFQELSPQPERWEEFVGQMFAMFASEPNYTEQQLRSIQTPFLILDGATEEAIDLNHTKLMARLIPGATLDIMPDTGHFAHFEQPAIFNAIVEDYLGA